MKAAVEISRDIDAAWLCRLWGRYSTEEMRDFMFGYLQLSANTVDHFATSEVRFLLSLCDTKTAIEREEA